MRDETSNTRSTSEGADYSVPAYAELSQILLSAQPLGMILHRVAEIARELIPGAYEVSIALIERDRARTVAFTGAVATALDERQYCSGRGPCLDASVTG